MRRRAVVTLLLRPLVLVLALVTAPLLAGLLFAASDANPTPKELLGLAAAICSFAGFGVAAAVAEAVRCTFTWTLPGYRRALAIGFVVTGVSASALITVALSLSSAAPVFSTVTLLSAVLSFASFSVGAVVATPESSVFSLLPFVIWVPWVQQRGDLAALLERPALVILAALGTSVVALGYAFSPRTFRWGNAAGPRRTFVWDEWLLIPGWARLRARVSRNLKMARRNRTTVGRASIATIAVPTLTVRPIVGLAGLAVFAICVASNRGTPGFASLALPITFVLFLNTDRLRRSPCRTQLPWPRHIHARFSYCSDLRDAVVFVVLTLGANWTGRHFESVDPALVRFAVVTVVLLPAAQWLIGPPAGGTWRNRVIVSILAPLLYVVFLIATGLVRDTLPAEAPSGVRPYVLGFLVIGSQFLHWWSLRWYCTTRDLVTGAQVVE